MNVRVLTFGLALIIAFSMAMAVWHGFPPAFSGPRTHTRPVQCEKNDHDRQSLVSHAPGEPEPAETSVRTPRPTQSCLAGLSHWINKVPLFPGHLAAPGAPAHRSLVSFGQQALSVPFALRI